MSAHEHAWKPLMHIDGCHTYEWRYACECGAVRRTWAERQMREGYGPVWALDECERCQELLAGARRKRRVVEVVEART